MSETKTKTEPKTDAKAAPALGGIRMSLKLKFASFQAVLILLLMGSIGFFVLWQQSGDLGNEVRERGASIARNLAANSQEAILTHNLLDLAVMVSESVQRETSTQGALPAWLAPLEPSLPPQGLRLLKEAFAAPIAAVKNEGVVEAMIVDTEGTIIAHSDSSKNGKPYTAPTFLPQTEGEAFRSYYGRNGLTLYDISEPMRDKISSKELGTVHLGLDRGIIERTVRGAALKLGVIAVAGLVFGLLISYLVVTWMVRPVGRLVRGVMAIAGGDFNQELKVYTSDELGALTNSFNEMTKTLREKQTLEAAFERYVSHDAKEQVLADPSKAGIHGKRIEATVYFSDIRGFTAMSETMQPEEVVNVINEYLGAQALILTNAGGQVNKFVGDATMAIFGMKDSHPDDPLRAVKAAIKVQSALKKMNEQRTKHGQVAKLIGIGVNTGEMVVGNIGSAQKMEYTAMGDEVTLSDKLCAVCEGGGILISESTYQRVKEQVDAKKLEPLVISGRKEPVEVYQVLGMKK